MGTTEIPSFTITVTRPDTSTGVTEEPEFTTVPGPTEVWYIVYMCRGERMVVQPIVLWMNDN